MKKKLLAVTLLSAAVCFNASARVLKLAHAMPLDHPVSKTLNWFAEQVNDRTKLHVKIYPSATLGKEATTLQMVQNGTLAFTKVAGGLISSYSDEYKVLALPYLYKDEADSKRVLRGPVGQSILESSKKDGFIGLAFLSSGSRNFYSNHKIQKPEDLKGLKIRVQNAPIDIETMKILGASPVPIAFSEIYSALQQGVVDGAENNLPSYFSLKHYEVAKYFTMDHHTMIPDILVVSTEVWESLSDKDKKTIRQISKEMLSIQDKNWDEYVAYGKEQLKKNHVQFIKADVPAFQEKVMPVYDTFKKQNPQLILLLEKLQNY